MGEDVMKRYFYIAKEYIKNHYVFHLVAAIIICMISPLFMGTENLNAVMTARVLEQYISLIGIILFVPIFLPDQDIEIRNLIRSKKEPVIRIKIIRLLEEVVALAGIVTVYIFYLIASHCSFPVWNYWFGTVSTCIFLGGIGILTYALIDNPPIAYAIPLLYYMLCYGSGEKYLGKFYLFSMSSQTVSDKIYLLAIGISMMFFGLWMKRR